MNWPAVAAARAHDASRRVPFAIGDFIVGAVARGHLEALHGWPDALVIDAGGVRLVAGAGERDAVLAEINRALRHEGLIRAWRDEAIAVCALTGGPRLARMERAAARFWGTRTLGAHANGYVADAQGRPTHLWLAQRAFDKATDPGCWDNLVGGGVPDGQTPGQALVREGFEEAGLDARLMATARPARVLHLCRDIHEGLQREDLHAFDLRLPTGVVPVNQDGEVAGFECLPLAEALARAAGASMTVDAAVVTLDFALRHHLAQAPPGVQDLLTPG